MSKTQLIYHIVFGTKNREYTLEKEKRRELYKYIFGILKNLDCHLIRMNGIEDHIHILLETPPSISLSDLVKKIKQSSSHWLKETGLLPLFVGWGRGYFAVTVSPCDIETCKNYIINQEEHHKGKCFYQELKSMIEELGLDWHDDELK